jgi:hypothetical protein
MHDTEARSTGTSTYHAGIKLQSPHRTFDWEEADYFYCPVYVNLFVHPVYGWADGPWFNSAGGMYLRRTTTVVSNLCCKRSPQRLHSSSWARPGAYPER